MFWPPNPLSWLHPYMRLRALKFKKLKNLKKSYQFLTYRFFPTYREVNCQVECSMHQTMKLCDCLPYFYYNTENIEVCDISKLDWIVSNREILKKVKAPEKNHTEESCNCPTQCESTSFSIRMSSTDIIPEMSRTVTVDPFQWV